MLYGAYCSTNAEFSSVTETIRPAKPKIFTIHRKLLQLTDLEGKTGKTDKNTLK